MTIAATYSKIQSMNAASSGIVSAPTEMPTKLTTVDLPCALCFPGSGEWHQQAASYKRQEREYAIRVFVKPVVQGEGIDEGFQACLAPLQAMGSMYMSSSGLSLESTVENVRNVRDSGISILTFGGIDYHGFELKISVTEKWL